MDPANSNICRDQLGIAPSMTPDLAPAYERARDAAKDLVDNWDRMIREEIEADYSASTLFCGLATDRARKSRW